MNNKKVKSSINSNNDPYSILWEIFRKTMLKVLKTTSLREAKSLAREALLVLNKQSRKK